MGFINALADTVQGDDGGYSTMRISTLIICIAVLTVWIIFCFIENRFISPTWEMVTLISGSQGAKAIQYKFEKSRYD